MKSFLKKNYQYGFIIVTAIISYFGFQQFYFQEGKPYPFFDIVYSVIRLFLVENDAENSGLNIFLQIARFAAPASLATAVITGILNIFSRTFKTERVKLFSNHVIFSSDNDNLNALVREQEKKKNKFVIGLFGGSSSLSIKSKESVCINSNTVNENALRDLAFYKAKYFIISYKDDLQSIDLATQLIRQIKVSQLKQAIEIILVFNSPEWSELSNDLKLLEETNKELVDNPNLNIRYINYYDKFIRKVMLQCSPDIYKPIILPSQEPLQILITDFNEIAKRLIIGLSLHCHYINHKRLKVYIFGGKKEEMKTFVEIYQLSYSLDIEHVDVSRLFYFDADIDIIYLCNAGSLNLYKTISEIKLNSRLKDSVKIICTEESYDKEVMASGIDNVLSLKEQIQSITSLIDDTIDNLAKTIHTKYLHQRSRENNLSTEIDTHKEWEILSDETKDRNRYPADHISVKVRSMGCEIVSDNDTRETFDITKYKYLEELSHAEHNRWCAYMYYKGWRFNKTRDNDLKLHPDLIPYEELSEEDKQKDRDNILQIPELLKIRKLKIVKKG